MNSSLLELEIKFAWCKALKREDGVLSFQPKTFADLMRQAELRWNFPIQPPVDYENIAITLTIANNEFESEDEVEYFNDSWTRVVREKDVVEYQDELWTPPEDEAIQQLFFSGPDFSLTLENILILKESAQRFGWRSRTIEAYKSRSLVLNGREMDSCQHFQEPNHESDCMFYFEEEIFY